VELTNIFIKNAKHSGRPTGDKHSDGGGLYLHVTAAGKYWRMAYRIHGKQKTLAIGVYPITTLAEAREIRNAAKKQLAQKIDPSIAKQEARHAAKVASTNTYELVAREFHETASKGWSASHAQKWLRMSELHLFTAFKKKPLDLITAKDVMTALKKAEAKGILSTAHSLRQMAGQVFRYAVQTSRITINPATEMKGSLAAHVAKNFAALVKPEKVSELLRAIDGYSGTPTTKAALQLSTLVFQRPGNIRAMEWAWIDLDNALLTIPAANMKRVIAGKVNGKPHYVPLAEQAIAILQGLQPLTGSGRYVFPGARSSQRPMSENTINAALKRMDFTSDDHVAHGFRAMARTMLVERMKGIDKDVIEAQLAHNKSDPLGNAYDRAEYMEQRHAMMQIWADYLDRLRIGAEVIPLAVKMA
jgi:integrase